MAFQYRKYIGFHEGLDDSSDARDISPNALADVNNMAVDRMGRLRTLGGFIESNDWDTIDYSGEDYRITPGHGLFMGSSDYNLPAGSSTPTDFAFLGVENTVTNYGALYALRGSTYNSKLGDKIVGKGYFSYAYADNCCYMAVMGSSYIRTIGSYRHFYYNRFSGTGREVGIQAFVWHDSSDFLAPRHGVVHNYISGTCDAMFSSDTVCCRDPAFHADWEHPDDFGDSTGEGRCRILVDLGGGTYKVRHGDYSVGPDDYFDTDALGDGDVFDSKDYWIYPGEDDDCGFMVEVSASSDDGTWTNDKLEFTMTYLYGDGAESEIKHSSKHNTSSFFTPTADKGIDVIVRACDDYSSAVTGGRVYYRKSGSNDEWRLFCEINLVNGVRSTPYSPYVDWNYLSADSNHLYYSDTLTVYDPSAITYEALNGYPQDTPGLRTFGQHVTIASNRLFVGRTASGVGKGMFAYDSAKWHGDRILYSNPGVFDATPPENYYDITTGDGDFITCLSGYNERLFVFKARKLYILNLSGGSPETWFIEASYEGMGVRWECQVFKTDRGLIWINERGCFFYDGESITNLVVKDWVVSGAQLAPGFGGQTGLTGASGSSGGSQPNITGQKRAVEHGIWTELFDDIDTYPPIVGVDPNTGKILVVPRSFQTSSRTINVYVYDFVTKSWVRGSGLDENYRHSNMASMNGKVYVFKDDHVGDEFIPYEWTDTMQSQSQYAVLIDDAFDDEAHYKRIYSVTLTYRGSANINMDDLLHYATDGSGSFVNTYVPSTQVSSGSTWQAVKIEFTQPIECQSFQIKLLRPSGTMEINDVTVKYRTIHKMVS